jgi:hypothetical protein
LVDRPDPWVDPVIAIDWKEEEMAARDHSGGGIGGISLGGILVIIGIVLMIVWSFWVGLIVLLIGLIAFGGFARGKWY